MPGGVDEVELLEDKLGELVGMMSAKSVTGAVLSPRIASRKG